MKTSYTFLIIIAFFIFGCKKDVFNFNGEPTDGFCIVSNDKVILNQNDIEYYDYSAHLIYMKNNKSFAEEIEGIGDFKVFANKTEVYTGRIFPGYSSYLPSGPVICTHPSGYGDYITPINFIRIIDTSGNFLPDPREDERIVKALKKYNQFHAGLSCEIKSVQYLSAYNVKVELKLTNNDPFKYYFLDPDKTGMDLFHYFTNGLYFRDFESHETYTHKVQHIKPEPWNSWKKEWLSIINGNESKTIAIVYDTFEELPHGQYKATFQYPGLTYQVEKKDVQQANGQIWLGKIDMIKDVTIE